MQWHSSEISRCILRDGETRRDLSGCFVACVAQGNPSYVPHYGQTVELVRKLDNRKRFAAWRDGFLRKSFVKKGVTGKYKKVRVNYVIEHAFSSNTLIWDLNLTY